MRPERPERRAEAFDAFRRELMRRAVPVQKDQRKEWEERFKEFVETAIPEPRKLFKKPGLAARLFAAEVEVPHSNERDMEVYSQQLEIVWPGKMPEGVVQQRTLTTLDRSDVIWEFAVDLGASYVTGSVKLRNFPFERPERREGAERTGERRPYQRDAGRPGERRPYQRDTGRTGERRPYKRDDDRGGSRPYRRDEGPKRPYRRDDRGGPPKRKSY